MEELTVTRQVLGGMAHFGSKTGSNDAVFVTNASGLKGNSPILIGLMEYFQVWGGASPLVGGRTVGC